MAQHLGAGGRFDIFFDKTGGKERSHMLRRENDMINPLEKLSARFVTHA